MSGGGGSSVREIEYRDKKLYEKGKDMPLNIRILPDGLRVGCTYLTWEAFEAIVRKAKEVR